MGKLTTLAEARKLCPELVVVEGEDLSPFRDVSKKLYTLLRTYSWNKKVERLGLDEVFLDATDIVDYNAALLNPNSLAQSFFYLSRQDPEQGFAFDATSIAGCVCGSLPGGDAVSNPSYGRLLLASHFARYLRLRIEEQGYTSAGGISTNKLLSKLVGNQNKPRNQTTLLGLHREDVLSFVAAHPLRKVPGIGSRTTRLLEAHVLQKAVEPEVHSMECVLTAGDARSHPGMSAHVLERILGGPGAERGIGEKVWGLLHGVDRAEVKAASDLPTQISIEDTYQGLDSMAQITQELRKIAASLLRRMHLDLVDEADEAAGHGAVAVQRWQAHPRTIRLTTRPKYAISEGKPYNYNRVSHSRPLPTFIFSFATPREEIIEKLVSECLLPMFRKLNPEPSGWHIGLLNICVANLVRTGTPDPAGRGRDISIMFRTQEDVLKEFRVYDHGPTAEQEDGKTEGGEVSDLHVQQGGEDDDEGTEGSYDGWGDDLEGLEACTICGIHIPHFAAGAHQRYHLLGD